MFFCKISTLFYPSTKNEIILYTISTFERIKFPRIDEQTRNFEKENRNKDNVVFDYIQITIDNPLFGRLCVLHDYMACYVKVKRHTIYFAQQQ